MHTIQNTLYVMTPHAYAHLENATVRIDVEREKKLQVPLHHIGSLVTFGNIMISPALMHRLALLPTSGIARHTCRARIQPEEIQLALPIGENQFQSTSGGLPHPLKASPSPPASFSPPPPFPRR